MKEKEVKSAFAVLCHGVAGILTKNGQGPVNASVTVFEDGSRQVGCGYLGYNTGSNGDRCSAGIDVDCPHLKPQTHRA